MRKKLIILTALAALIGSFVVTDKAYAGGGRTNTRLDEVTAGLFLFNQTEGRGANGSSQIQRVQTLLQIGTAPSSGS